MIRGLLGLTVFFLATWGIVGTIEWIGSNIRIHKVTEVEKRQEELNRMHDHE